MCAPLSESGHVCSFYHQPLWTTVCADVRGIHQAICIQQWCALCSLHCMTCTLHFFFLSAPFAFRRVTTWGLLTDQRGIEPPPAICQRQECRHSNWATRTPAHCILLEIHTDSVLMRDDFPEVLLRCKTRSRKISATDQVLQPDIIDGPGAPDDYWFETVETHRCQIAGQPGCQGFVGGSAQG